MYFNTWTYVFLVLFSKETGGLGDQRKFIRITRRFITCFYHIQFEKNWHVPHLKCRTDLCPSIHLRLKVIPSWMDKKVFYMQMLPPHINQNGSAKVEWGRKLSIASSNKECITILSNRSLRTELSIDFFFAIKRGVLQ